jgi:hypothetical protein
VLLRLLDVPITEADALALIATLITDGRRDALSAAAMVRMGLDDESYPVALTPEQRDAILSVLEGPPSESLAELRVALLRDRQYRRGAHEDGS